MIRLGVLTKALLAQVGALVFVVLLLRFQLLAIAPSVWIAVLLQAVLAAAIALLLRSDRWWLFIHLVFPVAVALGAMLRLHPGWYLAAFVLLVLVFGPSYRSRVPLYLSNQKTIHAVAVLLDRTVLSKHHNAHDKVRVLDFGSGTGVVISALARRYPGHRFEGIEGALMPYLISCVRGWGLPNLFLARGDFWQRDLSPYQMVYAFLSTQPMPQLWQKACAQMRPGSFLVSNSFEVPGVPPIEVIDVGDSRNTRLHVYRIG